MLLSSSWITHESLLTECSVKTSHDSGGYWMQLQNFFANYIIRTVKTKWNNLQFVFLCSWDGRHGTRNHNHIMWMGYWTLKTWCCLRRVLIILHLSGWDMRLTVRMKQIKNTKKSQYMADLISMTPALSPIFHIPSCQQSCPPDEGH